MYSFNLDLAEDDILRGSTVNHNQILNVLVSLGLKEMTQLDRPASASLNSTLRELIIDLGVDRNGNFSVTINTSRNGNLETWEKKTCEKD